MRGWFIIHTLSSCEKRVAGIINKNIESGDFEDMVFDVTVPVEQVIEMRNSRKVKRERKFFPGYVLVEMEMNTVSMNRVKKISGVTNFIGATLRQLPKALSEKELNEILNKTADVVSETEELGPKIFVSIDEKVKIIDGPFKGFHGVVDEIHPEKGRIKVQVEIFGRPTPVDLDFLQIEKL